MKKPVPHIVLETPMRVAPTKVLHEGRLYIATSRVERLLHVTPRTLFDWRGKRGNLNMDAVVLEWYRRRPADPDYSPDRRLDHRFIEGCISIDSIEKLLRFFERTKPTEYRPEEYWPQRSAGIMRRLKDEERRMLEAAPVEPRSR